MRRWRWLFSFLCVLSAVSAAAATPAPSLVGVWFGLGEPNDPDTFYLDSFHADGTFNSEYRRCENAKVAYRQTQSGKWNYANGILTMHSDIINDMPGTDQHAYVIEQLSADEFRARLRAPDPDYLFVEKRVMDFDFPPCGAAS